MPSAGNGPAKTTYCRRDDHKKCPGRFRNAHMATPSAEAGRPCRCVCHGCKEPPDLHVLVNKSGEIFGFSASGRQALREGIGVMEKALRGAKRQAKRHAKRKAVE